MTLVKEQLRKANKRASGDIQGLANAFGTDNLAKLALQCHSITPLNQETGRLQVRNIRVRAGVLVTVVGLVPFGAATAYADSDHDDVLSVCSSADDSMSSHSGEDCAAEQPAAEEPAAEESADEDPAEEDAGAEDPAEEDAGAEDPAEEDAGAEDPAEDPATEDPNTPDLATSGSPLVQPSVIVQGASASVTPAETAVNVLAATAAVNPLPTAAAAGQSDTSGQLASGGFAGFAGFLVLMAGFVLRRRRGQV